MESWKWRAEGLRMEPPPSFLPGPWDLFQSPLHSAKSMCLTLHLPLFGLSFQELAFHFPARLQSPSAHISFSPGKYFYKAVQFFPIS